MSLHSPESRLRGGVRVTRAVVALLLPALLTTLPACAGGQSGRTQAVRQQSSPSQTQTQPAQTQPQQAQPPLPQTKTPRETHVLRVCADPNNLPFSNRRGEGFENKLAELVAREFNAAVEYTWWAQRRGFFRNTLKAGACDVVMGVPSGFEMALTTSPYYRSTYVFVTRRDRNLNIRSFDDPILRKIKIGVQMVGDDFSNTPPAHALTARKIVDNVEGFTLYGDYAQENPPARIIDAVAKGTVDVAVVWGPLAGYFARKGSVPLEVVPVSPQIDGPSLPFVYDISMGVRRGDQVFKDELEAILERRHAEIESILEGYGVPRVEAGKSRPVS
ncbi:MAG: mxaJ protein [Acidobacteriota bacterium]|nr:mxaJ protein [Acidobacteriota bacterium]